MEVGVKMNNTREVIQSLLVGLGVAIGASCLVQPAEAVTYITTGGSQLGIGDEMSSGFDQLLLTGYSSDISGYGTIELNPLDFTAGLNAYSAETVTGTLSEELTVGGVTQSLSIPYSDNISDTDTLTIFGGNSLVFGGYTITLDTYVSAPNGGGDSSGVLYATVSGVPEISTWAMMLLGFAGLGFVGHRASRRNVELPA